MLFLRNLTSEVTAKPLLIFDLDGTIVNCSYREDRCFESALDDLLPTDAIDYWEGVVHYTDEAVARNAFRLNLDRDPTAAEIENLKHDVAERLKQCHLENPHYFVEVPCFKEMLSNLEAQDDFLIGVATGNWKLPAFAKLSFIGLEQLNIPLIGCDLHESKKGFVTQMISDFKNEHQVSSVTYIGDSIYDFKTSNELGINFVGVDSHNDQRLQKIGADFVIPDFKDISFLNRCI